ncbi:cytochrome c oxidase subunit I [Frigidibacter oleivorans]|uniref:cytochrome c oxidase subunit I n=1 Tax=Frigidibacter oleivorans TaxID=2487129 RepID=UPI001F1E43CF|nr:cytochrome c oxidase subunit I [Frigidibacter oleivorans]
MLSEPVPGDVARAQEDRLRRVWKTPEGWRYFSDVNNTSVGRWYCLTAFFFMLCAGVLALLMRLQLAVPGNDLLSADRFNQFFTLHGSAMMFLFAVPIFEAVSILILPALLGARDLPFPRLSAYGYWCFLIGGIFVMGSVLFDVAPRSGWFMYPPLATEDEGIGSDIWLLGLSFIEVASIAAAVELIVGVLKCRPPGMRVNLMPLYAWYVLVVGGMILFAFPPLIAGDLLFELERSLDWPFFDAARGGDPVLWQHLFWIFGHPEVYIVFLPSIALAAMIVPTAARRPILGYSWIVLSAVGTGFLSFGLWVHHMFTTGLPTLSLGFFSAASEAVVIPTGVQLFAFVATLMAGRVKMSLPMLWIAGALAIFTAGGLTGVMVAIAPFDWQVHDTYFIVAHLHYTLFGGMVFPVIGGVYYFFPVITGKELSNRLGRWAFWLIFAGFNLAFLPMHLTGLKGMPRRVFTYPGDLGLNWLNLVSTVASFVIAAGFAVFLWDLLRPKGSRRTPRNPYDAGTLEWSQSPEGETWGVRSIPYIHTRYPLWQQERILERMDAGRYYLPDAEAGQRETIITSVIDARPLQVLRLSGPTWVTMLAALFTGGTFILPTFKMYAPALICGVLAAMTVLYWLWTATARIPERETVDAGLGLKLPVYVSGSGSVGWWAMWITMLGDSTAFASLVFGVFFYWTARSDYPPPGSDHADPWLAGAALAAALLSWGLTLVARGLNRRRRRGARLALAAALPATMAAGAALFYALRLPGLDPVTHVYPASMWVLVVWAGAHLGLGLVMQGYCLAGLTFGRITPRHDAPMWNVSLYWHFLALTMLVTVATLAVVPRVM